MSAALAGRLVVLGPALAHPDLPGVVALLGLCAGGGLVYGALGAVLGVVKLSETALPAAPPAGRQTSRPNRTTVTPARNGRFDEGITSTQLS